MTHDQLIALQNAMSGLFIVMLGAGALYLVLGLIGPAHVGAASRGRVVLRTLAVWFLAAASLAGTLAYTHSHPNGPHSVTRYIDDYFKDQCAEGTDLPACKDGASAAPAAPAEAAPQP